eukprot:g16701.t1
MSKSSASNNRAYRHCPCHDCKRLGLVQSEKTIRVHAQRANAVDQRVQQSKRPQLKRTAAGHMHMQTRTYLIDWHEEAIEPMQMQEDSGEDESQIAQNSDEDDAYDNQQGINSPGVQQKVESAGLLQFQEEVGGDGLQSALFPGGLLTRGAVLDMLAELAAFHHAPRDLMQGVVDILNLVALDGGTPAPVLPTCTQVDFTDVKESLDAVLAHPNVQDYLPAGHRADMQTHLYIPDEFKGSPAWNAFVSNPNVLSLAVFFDGVPCFRLVNTSYTVHLVTLEILNLPFYLRANPRFTVWSDIIPGPSKPQVLKPWLKPLMLDLEINEWNQCVYFRGLHCAGAIDESQAVMDCIQQSVEDALHLVEGCIKRHLF